MVVSADEGVLARIAVLPEFRGRRLGQRVIRELEAIAEELGARRLSLKPHRHLESFYLSQGYETTAGEETVAGHVLITMVKKLTGEAQARDGVATLDA